jgi:hypothetical protein
LLSELNKRMAPQFTKLNKALIELVSNKSTSHIFFVKTIKNSSTESCFSGLRSQLLHMFYFPSLLLCSCYQLSDLIIAVLNYFSYIVGNFLSEASFFFFFFFKKKKFRGAYLVSWKSGSLMSSLFSLGSSVWLL